MSKSSPPTSSTKDRIPDQENHQKTQLGTHKTNTIYKSEPQKHTTKTRLETPTDPQKKHKNKHNWRPQKQNSRIETIRTNTTTNTMRTHKIRPENKHNWRSQKRHFTDRDHNTPQETQFETPKDSPKYIRKNKWRPQQQHDLQIDTTRKHTANTQEL